MLLKKSELDFKNEGKLQELYVIGSEIGKGSFGKVRNVYHKITRQQRACKCVPKDTVNQNLFDSEVENLVLLALSLDVLKKVIAASSAGELASAGVIVAVVPPELTVGVEATVYIRSTPAILNTSPA